MILSAQHDITEHNKTAQLSFVVGSHIWIEDPDEAWIEGEILESKGNEITVNCASGTKVISKSSHIYPKDPEFPPNGVDDMTRLPHLYSRETMEKYKGAAFGEKSPNPFAIADSAYRKMINEETSQSILVSGESGAGKTESTKMLMCYLAYMGGRAANEGRSVEQQVLELQGLDDSKEYLATRRAMDVVGINGNEQDAIFRIVAAVLHLGNIEFVKGDDEETDSSQPKDDKSRFHLKTAAELLMCDEKSLEDSFCKRVMVTRGDKITKSLDPVAASLSRDALAKIIYSRLFDWIVDKINNSIGQDPHSKNLIGVLDIYGFESFKTNSFEQFCINLTNEKLQQHFNQHVFKMEQEEYTKEEINWSYIEFVDNQDVLDLIEKKPGGIIALLDEACMFPRSTHETFAEKLYQTFKDNKRFSKPKLSRTDFTVNHYAGDVTYQTDLFLDKNKDYVVPEHAALLNASKCNFVSGLFPPLPEETSKSTKFASVATQFKQQLQSLLETLNATEPHYIRCVKPNNLLKPGIFENSNVLQQLRCGGVMEAIRISCAGYPTRKNFDEFIRRFSILEPKVLTSCPDEMTSCKMLLDKVNLKDYQIGKTKVFLRVGQMAQLDACRAEVLGRSATIIQRKVCTYLCQKHYNTLRMSAIQLQRVVRGQLARFHYEKMRREDASVKIQKNLRMHLSKTAYQALKASAVFIQTAMRGKTARNQLRYRKLTRAAVIIERHGRGYIARSHYKRLKKAAIFAQCSWRRTMARRELRKLRMAAKEAKALEAAKKELEKQVEELSLSLESERRMREAKTQENEKLQSALHEMELQLKETQASLHEMESLLLKERQAPKTADTTPMQVIQSNGADNDIELISKLTAENEQLKGLVNSLEKKSTLEIPSNMTENEVINMLSSERELLKDQVSSLEQKINETERKYEECSKLSEERMNQIIETESKIIELKTSMQRLEEKVSDMETENQVLRQKSLSSSSSKKMSEKNPSQSSENGSNQASTSASSGQTKTFGTDADSKVRTSHMERHLGFRSSKSLSSGSFDVEHQVDAKYPALLFKQQLAAYVEKIYGILRENLKKDISPLISAFIQAHGKSDDNNHPAASWTAIVQCINRFLNIFKENHVHPVLVQKIFSQVFQHINAEIFNSLVSQRECCTFNNGQLLKSGLAELEQWSTEATEEVVEKKDELSYDGLTNELCPVLSSHQLYRICTLYWDGNENDSSQSVSSEVISSLKLLMTDGVEDDSKSYMLEDNSSIPIIVEEISSSLKDKTTSKVKPPEELLENAGFQFLHDYS
ncbi:hypothetical protein Ahy_A10g046800 [Arachis hypogaea]|uniref:Myosin motor domain-containing protein n=1 Tax=Arachis hypogaea TaxID=3818 RepID=A0A445B0I8_ARAHY|nr:hypothetical protein Ahy_A10g046800 [Arachis hypogaea]